MAEMTIESVFGVKAGIVWEVLNKNGPLCIRETCKGSEGTDRVGTRSAVKLGLARSMTFSTPAIFPSARTRTDVDPRRANF
jgi:hypothetical protein